MDFFNKLSQKASETYKNTAEKTNKLAREVKLKAQMSDNKNKIEDIYIEIGKKVYEKHIREENIDIRSDLSEECAKIDAYAKEIEDMEVEMRVLKDLRLCKKCAAEISINAKFCPKCGEVQEELKVESNTIEVKPEEVRENEPEVEIVEQQPEPENVNNDNQSEDNQN